jgi:hypothetical protein
MIRSLPIPLRADPGALDDHAMAVLARACIAAAAGKLNPAEISAKLVTRRWGSEAAREVELLARAASAPATMTTPGWAQELAHVTATFLRNLQPFSAGADLLTRCLGLSFDRAGVINLPKVTTPMADFVAEQAPIPVADGAASNQASVAPFKFAVIVVLTSEMINYSNGEALVRDALLQATGPALDRRLFDANAGVANLRPPGLLYGITALPASSATVPTDAMQADLEALLGAVAVVAGNSPIVVVASPTQAVAIGLKTYGSFAYPILVSNALPTGTIIAVAVNAVVNASGAAPQIDTTAAATLHMSDTPAPIATGGAMAQPGPVIATYQNDVVGLRLRWPLSWAVRDAHGIAWMQGVNW